MNDAVRMLFYLLPNSCRARLQPKLLCYERDGVGQLFHLRLCMKIDRAGNEATFGADQVLKLVARIGDWHRPQFVTGVSTRLSWRLFWAGSISFADGSCRIGVRYVDSHRKCPERVAVVSRR
jgi:hypothetical protein